MGKCRVRAGVSGDGLGREPRDCVERRDESIGGGARGKKVWRPRSRVAVGPDSGQDNPQGSIPMGEVGSFNISAQDIGVSGRSGSFGCKIVGVDGCRSS